MIQTDRGSDRGRGFNEKGRSEKRKVRKKNGRKNASLGLKQKPSKTQTVRGEWCSNTKFQKKSLGGGEEEGQDNYQKLRGDLTVSGQTAERGGKAYQLPPVLDSPKTCRHGQGKAHPSRWGTWKELLASTPLNKQGPGG